MAEDKNTELVVVITQDQYGRDVTIPVDENGNVILYRSTDDPYRIVDSDFKSITGDVGTVGFGQQSYFSPNPMYSHTYEKPDRKNYKFKTSIKPNEILVMTKRIKDFPELVKALNIPEEFTNMTWWQFMQDDKVQVAMGYEMGSKRFFTENIQVFKDNGIKAFAYSSGTGGQTYIEYEIIPLIKDGDTLDIKPVAILEVEEGLAGKTPDAFIENTIDTPKNLVDDVIKLQDNINDYLNEIILENPSRSADLAVDPLTLTLSDDGKFIDITEFVIDENYRNQGLGTEVFNRIKEFANNNNLSITTTPFVGELEDLVKKEGFVKEGNQYILKPDTPTNVVDINTEFENNPVLQNEEILQNGRYIKGSVREGQVNRQDKILIESIDDFELYSKIPFSEDIEFVRSLGVGGISSTKEIGFTSDNQLYIWHGIDNTYEYVDPKDKVALKRFLNENGLMDLLNNGELYLPFSRKVDQGILTKDEILKFPFTPQLYHGRGKNSRVPENYHAGTYQAAVDRNAFMFGDENMYSMIYDIKNNFISEISEALSNIKLTDGSFYTEVYLQPEVKLPNGNVDIYDIRIDVLEDGTVSVVLGKDGQEIATVFYDRDVSYYYDSLEDGAILYDHINQENLDNVINDRSLDKYFGEAGGFLDPDRSFQYRDGYYLYKVTINPNAKIVEFTENIEIVVNGQSVSVDPDIFVNYLESGDLKDVDEILLPNGEKITLSGSNKEKLNTIKNEIDVVGYRNQMEDVGSTSYYFLNEDVFEETLVDKATNTTYDNDVLEKFVKNDPYKDISVFKDASTERQSIAKNFIGEIEDVSDVYALLETRMKKYTDTLEWSVDVIKPNRAFNPDDFTRLVTPEDKPPTVFSEPDRYVWNDTTEFKPSEMYSRILNGTATDEDITKFFIYLATHSDTQAYARQQFKNPDAKADIVKIGIFSDLPLDEIIPMGQPGFEKKFIEQLKVSNSLIGDEIYKVLVDLVNEQGQFTNLKERMRKVILEAHKKIYAANPNDYFIVWRGGPLNRFVPWQSASSSYSSAEGIMYQMVQGGFSGGGGSVEAYIVHKNNFIDLDALGLSFGNEKEIIVLTEELNSPLAKRGNIKSSLDIQNIKDWWVLNRTQLVDAFPKNGNDIKNLFKRLTDAGQATQEFFNTVIEGMDPAYRPKGPYQQIIELNDSRLYKFQDDYNAFIRNGGNFNQHIFTSIPTFYETQIAKMQGITNMVENNPLNNATTYKILDIGGTEGAWAKALAKNNPYVQIEVLDPNLKALQVFEQGELVTNATFTNEAFTHVVSDQGKAFIEGGIKQPVNYARFGNRDRWDIVHESMAFQFISNERAEQISYIKENLLNENGVLIIEEKYTDNNQVIYDANEVKKNDFKRQYYTDEQLQNKNFNILLDMEGNQISIQEMEQILNDNFKHVEQYWDSGNFKGFIASDDAQKVEDFLNGINDVGLSLTNHSYSTSPTDTDIKGAVEKKMFNNGTDSKVAAELAKETLTKNPNFFQRVAGIIDNFDPTYTSLKYLARLGIVGGPVLNFLAKAAPVYAPGDVMIEKSIEKVVPYLDDAAAKLGLGRIPFKRLLPTYIVYEIGVAMADVVQAALYADSSAYKYREGGVVYNELRRPELDATGKPVEVLGMSAYDYFQTPPGKKQLEKFDFGSQFMKELESEKISRYSPGWGLTKAIFGFLGTSIPESQANISKQTRGNVGQALLTGINK